MLTPTGFNLHRNPGVSCCGGNQIHAEITECLRYPVFEHRSLMLIKIMQVALEMKICTTKLTEEWKGQNSPLRCTGIYCYSIWLVFSVSFHNCAPRHLKKKIIIVVLWMYQQQHLFQVLTLSKGVIQAQVFGFLFFFVFVLTSKRLL